MKLIPSSLLLACGICLSGVSLGQEVETRTLEYSADGQTFKGTLAWDAEQDGVRPGVLVVHEWWGLDEHARGVARRLAEKGYIGLAVDMYGNAETADHPDDAAAMAGSVRGDINTSRNRFLAARDALASHEHVDADRIAAIGYCFGGSVVLDMARTGVDIAAVISVHGALATETPAEKGTVTARILVLHGEADELVPPDQVNAFREEMAEAEVGYRFVGFEGAAHSFTNPEADRFAEEFELPLAYDEEADEAAWEEITRFLAKVLSDEE